MYWNIAQIVIISVLLAISLLVALSHAFPRRKAIYYQHITTALLQPKRSNALQWLGRLLSNRAKTSSCASNGCSSCQGCATQLSNRPTTNTAAPTTETTSTIVMLCTPID
ncbi:DUF6587 family protein [Zhongshania sp.]|uniref:DUF6587 family protein n=1 Tax=Zhongshania sp. TaxID=1971902 RepID=UPI003459DD52